MPIVASIYLILSIILAISSFLLLFPTAIGKTFGAIMSLNTTVVSLFAPQFFVINVTIVSYLYYKNFFNTEIAYIATHFSITSSIFISLHLIKLYRAEMEFGTLISRDQLSTFEKNFWSSAKQSQLNFNNYETINKDALLNEDAIDLSHFNSSTLSIMRYFTFLLPEFKKVKVKRNIEYHKYIEHNFTKAMKLDFYTSIDNNNDNQTSFSTKKKPAVIYIHGGGWVIGTKRQGQMICYTLASAGFDVFAISYRLAPKYPLPLALFDCKRAIAWIKNNAEKYNIDKNSIAVMGGSAGGHLTAMMALTADKKEFQPGFEEMDTSINSAVICYGLHDFIEPIKRKSFIGLQFFLEKIVVRKPFDKNEKLYQSLQPMSYISKEVPPLLILHGTNDSMVSINQSRNLYENLKKTGAPVVFCHAKSGLHAFDIFPSPLQQKSLSLVKSFLCYTYNLNQKNHS